MSLTLESSALKVRFSSLGARISSCIFDNIETTFGAPAEDQVYGHDIYSGVVCGRHAGRITNAQFPLDGETIKLNPNFEGKHQLHGGVNAFHNRRWDYLREANRITFTLQSRDGEEGFPGHMEVRAAYTLRESTLALDITATTTKPTIANITNHAYWNMAGGGSVLGHELEVPAQAYFPLNDLLLPTGQITDVTNTRWDFRKARAIAEDYDNALLLDGKRGELKRALTLRDPASGRTLDVFTTEPVVQIYTAIHWNDTLIGQHGPLARSSALAIEPQNVADAPNHPAFPSSVLRPGEIYRNRIEWWFST